MFVVKKIFGWVLLAWMPIALIDPVKKMMTHNGVRFATELVALVAVVSGVAAIGLSMALGKKKPPADS